MGNLYDICSRKIFRRLSSVVRLVWLATLLVGTPGLHSCKDIEQPSLWTLFIPQGNAAAVGVVSSDFGAAGRFTTIHSSLVVSPLHADIYSDAVAVYHDGKVYVLNRLNRDSVQLLDRSLNYLPVGEYSVESASNPQDMVFYGGLAYLTRYNRNDILALDPATGIYKQTISLAGYEEATPVPDGYPEATRMHVEGDQLYVMLQRLDRNDLSGYFPPVGSSLLLQIDLPTSTIVQSYVFPFANPFGNLQRIDLWGHAYLVTAAPARMGYLSQMDGGVVAFNLDEHYFRSPVYLESVAGGDILDVAILNETTGYAFVMDASFNKSIQRFNPTTGEKVSVLASFPASGGTVAGLLLDDDGRLYVADASFETPGISVYDAKAGDQKLTPFPLDVGLRPAGMVLIR